jgi:hypothetical protein
MASSAIRPRWGYVIDGTLRCIGFEVMVLRAGDAVSFD